MATGAGHPAVSVVLPVRNRSASIGAAVRSVLNQDYTDLEVIVVDDASTDESPDVVEAMGQDDARLRLLRLDRRVGAPAARNRGIATARGSLVAFQDSDDVWCRGHLSSLVRVLDENEDAVLAYGYVRRPPSEGAKLIPGPGDEACEGDMRGVLTRYNLVNLPSCVVRASALAAVGAFDERFPRYQDWDLVLSLAELGSFCFVDEVVTEAGDAPARISQDASAEVEALALMLDKHARAFAADPIVEASHRARLIRLLLGQWRLAAAAREGARVAMHPRAFGAWFLERVLAGRSPLDRERRSRHRA